MVYKYGFYEQNASFWSSNSTFYAANEMGIPFELGKASAERRNAP